MKSNHIFLLFAVALFLFLATCANDDSGSDLNSLSDNGNASSDPCAKECHIAGDFSDPIVSNSEGILGKHKKHVGERRFSCYMCHYEYWEASSDTEQGTHRNGSLDTPNSTIQFVTFNPSRNPTGKWVDDTGPVDSSFDGANVKVNTGSCADLYCHGGVLIPNWYEDRHWICSDCHTLGSIIDPLTTNGTGTSGKHTIHVKDEGIDCQRCHENYPKHSSHANGKFGYSGIQAVDNNQIEIPVETELFVFFGGKFAGNDVSADFKTQDRSCSYFNNACHTSQTVNNWYSP